MTKGCSQCGQQKDLTEFYHLKSSKDGHRPECKACHNLKDRRYRIENREHIRARNAKYRRTNQYKAMRKRSVAKYRATEKYRETKRKYETTNEHKEKRRQQKRIKRRTWQGFWQTTWGGMNARTINGSHPAWDKRGPRSYLNRGIRLEVTREQYRQWCLERKDQIEQMYKDGLRPSIDRINGEGHYALENMQIIPFKANCGKTHHGKGDRGRNG